MKFIKDREKEKVREYISLYMQGESTLAQEKFLQTYFKKSDIDEEFLLYAPMFEYICMEQYKSVDKKSKVVKLWGSVSAVAAILIISFILFKNSGDCNYYINGEKIKNKELAINQAQQELDKLSQVLKILEERQESIQKSLSTINRIQIISNDKEKDYEN